MKTKIGDVFSVKIDESTKRFFQLVAFDLLQLNSDVIRVFKRDYAIIAEPDISIVLNDEIDFFAHCVTKFGIKMNVCEKIGNTNEIGNPGKKLFRDTNDYGSKAGEEPIEISRDWYVWRINDRNFTSVGKLEGENRIAEIGIVVNPYDIVDRIKTGRYGFIYPEYD